MKMPNAKSGGRWQKTCLATAGILYAAVTGGGIGTATYLDATRPAREIVPPREPLLPPCTADAVPKPEESATEQATVTAVELNVRQAPAGRIVGQLYRGDTIDILERRSNGGGVEWLRTPRGWIAARFVDVVAAAPTPAQAETCFPPGPWCPTPSPPFLPPFSQR